MLFRTIKFYRTRDHKCPVEDFLDSLPSKAAQKIAWILRLIEELEIVPTSYLKKLADTDGLWECRVKLGSNIYRIFAFFLANDVWLTNGFIKKSQKTPAREIERAQKYYRDHLFRIRR
jgi:phage-related protein